MNLLIYCEPRSAFAQAAERGATKLGYKGRVRGVAGFTPHKNPCRVVVDGSVSGTKAVIDHYQAAGTRVLVLVAGIDLANLASGELLKPLFVDAVADAEAPVKLGKVEKPEATPPASFTKVK